MQQATGDCIPVDPGDAHDAAVEKWNEYRDHDAQATPEDEVDAPGKASLLQSNAKKQKQPVHTILHQKHHKRKPVKGYMEAPERMTSEANDEWIDEKQKF